MTLQFYQRLHGGGPVERARWNAFGLGRDIGWRLMSGRGMSVEPSRPPLSLEEAVAAAVIS
jgi:hypothetical protein